jgi:hypothetical protein
MSNSVPIVKGAPQSAIDACVVELKGEGYDPTGYSSIDFINFIIAKHHASEIFRSQLRVGSSKYKSMADEYTPMDLRIKNGDSVIRRHLDVWITSSS